MLHSPAFEASAMSLFTRSPRLSLLLFAAAVLAATSISIAADPPKLELKKGDHICIIGNGLAERMQHYGWLETLLHARFPDHELVFRNLGRAGDEVDGWTDPNHRMRSMAFGTQDEWLAG